MLHGFVLPHQKQDLAIMHLNCLPLLSPPVLSFLLGKYQTVDLAAPTVFVVSFTDLCGFSQPVHLQRLFLDL